MPKASFPPYLDRACETLNTADVLLPEIGWHSQGKLVWLLAGNQYSYTSV
jgi:hypothetical protein